MEEKFNIIKVDQKNFDDFVKLIEQLAKYERQTPPDNLAKKRLKKDILGHQPRIYANLGLLNSKPIAYTIYYLTYSSYLALPIFYIEDIFVLNKWRKKVKKLLIIKTLNF